MSKTEQKAISYSPAEIELLETMQNDLARVYKRAAQLERENGAEYEDSTVAGATYMATMRTAMATAATGYAAVTEALHKAKP